MVRIKANSKYNSQSFEINNPFVEGVVKFHPLNRGRLNYSLRQFPLQWTYLIIRLAIYRPVIIVKKEELNTKTGTPLINRTFDYILCVRNI